MAIGSRSVAWMAFAFVGPGTMIAMRWAETMAGIVTVRAR